VLSFINNKDEDINVILTHIIQKFIYFELLFDRT